MYVFSVEPQRWFHKDFQPRTIPKEIAEANALLTVYRRWDAKWQGRRILAKVGCFNWQFETPDVPAISSILGRRALESTEKALQGACIHNAYIFV
jgi:hypothetical protein